NFPGGNTGTQMGGWFRREINSVADLNGLKMRIPGLGGQVMDRFGVSVQLITGGEIYQALERGAIDAAEWVGPYDDIKLGFDQVASYYYYPGWWEPGPGLSFYVNREAWDKLPAGYQAAFTAAARVADQAMMTGYDAKNPAALAELKQKGSVELRRFSDEILQAAQREAFALMEETAAGDAGYRKVFEAWKQFREDSYAWFSLAENGYSGFALQNV
ncbi:MAG: TRAP transporter substrate-binding protein DctP, partial [Bacteroidota bacterium]